VALLGQGRALDVALFCLALYACGTVFLRANALLRSLHSLAFGACIVAGVLVGFLLFMPHLGMATLGGLGLWGAALAAWGMYGLAYNRGRIDLTRANA
jgi:hypothetical protein